MPVPHAIGAYGISVRGTRVSAYAPLCDLSTVHNRTRVRYFSTVHRTVSQYVVWSGTANVPRSRALSTVCTENGVFLGFDFAQYRERASELPITCPGHALFSRVT
eukprot:291437-Rhodomonas_salina.1